MKPTIEEIEAAEGWLNDVMFYAVAGGNDKPEEFKRRSHAPKETIFNTLRQALAIAEGEMVVVPREATEWMIAVGQEARNFGRSTCDIYYAMIAAAEGGKDE